MKSMGPSRSNDLKQDLSAGHRRPVHAPSFTGTIRVRHDLRPANLRNGESGNATFPCLDRYRCCHCRVRCGDLTGASAFRHDNQSSRARRDRCLPHSADKGRGPRRAGHVPHTEGLCPRCRTAALPDGASAHCQAKRHCGLPYGATLPLKLTHHKYRVTHVRLPHCDGRTLLPFHGAFSRQGQRCHNPRRPSAGLNPRRYRD